MSEGFFQRNFVWWSSRDSIAAEKISALAITEVILSVAAYWWAAWYFDTYAHLLVSIIVAPLVLLRSDESVELGAEMFKRYLRVENIPLRSAKGLSLVFLFAVSAGGAGWLAADSFLVGLEGWPIVWRSVLIVIFGLNIGLAAVMASARNGAAAIAGVTVFAAAATIALVAIGVAVVALMSAGAAAGVGTSTITAVVAGTSFAALLVALMLARAILGAVWVAVLGSSLGVGTLIRAIATRLFASVFHLKRGAAAFPKNWWNTL